MKSIQDLAHEAGMYTMPLGEGEYQKSLTRFADLAIAQYRESLLAGVGEPDIMYDCERWYTADQMAAAVLRERIKTLESVVELSTVGAAYPELMKYLQAEIEAIRNTK